jgi:hypothetical protein
MMKWHPKHSSDDLRAVAMLERTYMPIVSRSMPAHRAQRGMIELTLWESWRLSVRTLASRSPEIFEIGVNNKRSKLTGKRVVNLTVRPLACNEAE